MPENDIKYNIVLPDGTRTVFNQEQYDEYKEKLFTKYNGAQVVSSRPYDPASDDDGSETDTYDVTAGGKRAIFSAEQFANNKEKLYAKYPDAKVNRIVDESYAYWEPRRQATKAKLDAIDSENEGFIREYQSKLRSSLSNEQTHYYEDEAQKQEIQDWVNANKAQYDTLDRQRRELLEQYYSNPNTIREYRDGASRAGYLYDRYIEKADAAETGAERRDWKRAAKLQDDIRKVYEAPNKYTDGDAANGFLQYLSDYAKGAGDVFSDKDFYTRGFTEIARNFDLRGIAKKIEEASNAKGGDLSESDIDRIISPSEKAELMSFYALSEAQRERADSISSAYRAGSSFADSVGYMAEFLLSSGLGNLAGKAMSGSSRALTSWLGKQLMSDHALRRAVAQGVTKIPEMSKATRILNDAVLKPVVQGIWHTGTQISSYATISENFLKTNDNGELISFGSAILNGVVDSIIENWSESVGGALDAGLAAPFKAAGWLGEKTLGGTSFARAARWLYESGPAQVLYEAGFNGILGEIAEEWVGNATRVAMGLMSKEEFKEWGGILSKDKDIRSSAWAQQAEMAASFAPMSLIGLSSSSIAAHRKSNQFKQVSGKVKGILQRQGVADEEIERLFNTRFDTAEDIGRNVAPYLQRAAQDQNSDDYKTILQFAELAGREVVFEEMDKAEKEDKRNSMREQISAGTGRFWQEGEDGSENVRVITQDGHTYFVRGGREGTLAAVRDDGQTKVFNEQRLAADVQDGKATDETLSMDDFLQRRVDEVSQSEESARMSQERAEQLAAVKQQIAAKPEVNMGTREAPVLAAVTAADNTGVMVAWTDEEGNYMEQPLTWNEVANKLQTPIEVKSDAELIDDAAKQLDDARARVQAYQNIVPGTEITVNLEGVGPVQYKFQKAVVDDGLVMIYAEDENGESKPFTEDMIEDLPGLLAVQDSLKAVNAPEEGANVRFTDENGNPVQGVVSAKDNGSGYTSVVTPAGDTVVIETNRVELDEAAKPEPSEDEEQPHPEILRDFRGNPIPMIETGEDAGEVDLDAFFDKDTEAWARWNDEQRADGGADSRQNIEVALKAVEKTIKAAQKEHDATVSPNKRRKQEAAMESLVKRAEQLQGLINGYDAKEAAAKAEEEKRKQMDEQRKKAEERALEEPQDITQLAVQAFKNLQSMGKLRGGLNKQDFRRETGLGNTELGRFFSWWAKKGTGMTVNDVADYMIELDGQYGFIPDAGDGSTQKDHQAARNAVIDLFYMYSSPSELLNSIVAENTGRAEKAVQQEEDAALAAFISEYGMTPEELDQVERLRAAEIAEFGRSMEQEQEEITNLAAEYYDHYGQSTAGTETSETEAERAGVQGALGEDSRGSEVLHGERADLEGGIPAADDGESAQAGGEGADQSGSVQGSAPAGVIEDLPEGGEPVQGTLGFNENPEVAAAEAQVDLNPTEAQKEAGNYQKGHVTIDGHDITIENPKGSVRSGVDAQGNPWSVTMNNTYGYIRRTEGVDGDHIDVFLSDNPTEGKVYVIDQRKPDGSFDEHKVMYGFASAEEAQAAYLANYSPGWQGLGTITEVSKDEFKKWIDSSHRKTKPFSEYKSVKAEGAQNQGPTEAQQQVIDFAGVESPQSAEQQPQQEKTAEQKESEWNKRKLEIVSLAEQVDAKDKEAHDVWVAWLKDRTKPNNTAIRQEQQKLSWQLEKMMEDLSAEQLDDLSKIDNKAIAEVIKDMQAKVVFRRFMSRVSSAIQRRKNPSGAKAKPFGKLNLFKYTSKDETTPMLNGVFHDKGYAVASTKTLLIADKASYEKKNEGKVVDKDGKEITAGNAKYPKWRDLLPEIGNKVTLNFTELRDFIASVRAEMEEEYVRVKESNPQYRETKTNFIEDTKILLNVGEDEVIAFKLGQLEKFAAYAEHIGAHQLLFTNNKRAVAVRSNRGVAMLMPVMLDIHVDSKVDEEAERLADDFHMRSFGQNAYQKSLNKETKDAERIAKLQERVAKWQSVIGDVFTVLTNDEDVLTKMDEESRAGFFRQKSQGEAVHGLYNPNTKRAYLYLPDITDTRMLDRKIMHEVISHKGLAGVMGEEGFNAFLDRVWNDMMDADSRKEFLEYVNGRAINIEDRRRAADEYVAHIAEHNTSIIKQLDEDKWQQFVTEVKRILNDMFGEDIFDAGVWTPFDAELKQAFGQYRTENAEAISERDAARVKANNERREDAVAAASGEETKATMTRKAENNPQVPISNATEKYEDWGEKIGMARKDIATSGNKNKDADGRPAWLRKYNTSNIQMLSEDDQRLGRILGMNKKFQEVINDISKGTDYTQPFVGFYDEEIKNRFTYRNIRHYITDEKREPIIFTSLEQYEATVPVFEARDQGFRVGEKGGKFVIYRRASNGKAVEYAEFDTKEEAVAYLTSPEGCTEMLNRKRENYELPALEKLTRNNMPDYRKGRNITPEDFQQTFGFRGGEFGNYVNADERQQDLNYAYDALMDLASLLGISPKALTLGGELSIAFGARGHGLVSSNAHYEATRAVINLTKYNGAGSLAHEWAHALDNYFGLQDAKATRIRDEKANNNNNAYLSEGTSYRRGARKEVVDAFNEVMNVLTKKTVTRQIALDGATAELNKWKEWLDRAIRRQRESVVRGRQTYKYNRKTKDYDTVKYTLTDEQLAEFDRLTASLLDDPTFKRDWDYGKVQWRGMGEVADKLRELVKDIMPDKKNANPLEEVFTAAWEAKKRTEKVEDAKAGKTETVVVETDMLKDSDWFDRSRASSYFTKRLEMFARALETYLANKMQEQGKSSDYLTYMKGPLYRAMWEHNPYPEGEELKAASAAFDKLFQTIEEKTDEQTGKQVLFSRAYHGTGADFDAFDHSFMGTGEGSQVYGWGTYVTTNRETGLAYARSVGGSDEQYERAIRSIENQQARDRMSLEKAKNDAEKRYYEDAIALADKRKEQMERHLYTVEIPDDNGQNYLHWNEPITREQSQKIMDAVREEVGDEWGEEFEYELRSGLGFGTLGRYVQGGLNYFLGDIKNYATDEDPGAERNAKFLSRLGIVGIEIPIDQQGGKRYPGSNYVIFSERDLKITDHLRFSKAWHGSGRQFDRFDHSHMGEGEGAQAHGWGTYVSMERDTAEGYATRSGRGAGYGERMAIRQTLGEIYDKMLDQSDKNRKAADRHMKWIKEHPEASEEDKEGHRKIADMLYENDEALYKAYDNALKARNLLVNTMEYAVTYKNMNIFTPLEEMEVIADATWQLNRLSIPNRQTYLDYYRYDAGQLPEGAALRKAYEFVKSTTDDDWISSRHLYAVEIPEDTGENYLDEQADAKLTEVLEVWDAIFKMDEEDNEGELLINLPDFHYFSNQHVGKSNEYLYEDVARILGSKREASKLFESIGYAGIKYDGRIDGKCAVIFNEDYIRITEHIRFSKRTKPAPEKTGIGYKVFYRGKDGKLYPPMVANPDGADTPIGVWLDADAAPVAGQSKTGRPQVKSGGKGTQGGSGLLAYRPGWHLGEIPYAIQFNRLNPETGEKDLFPADFVWAEVEYAADKDYQSEADAEGTNKSGKYQHSLAGLKKVPEDGFYRYRTNPNPETDPWIITGAMKVNRVLTDEEVDDLVRKAGREPQKREPEVRFSKESAGDILDRYENQDGSEEYPWMSESEMIDRIERELPYGNRTEEIFSLIDKYRRLDAEDFNEGRRDFSGSERDEVFNDIVDALREYSKGDVRFSKANESQRIFISNAAAAAEAVPMEKATPQQWIKMLTDKGGLKAGEDKWLGLSDWLKAQDRKTISKQEVLDFIAQNQIQIEEEHYSENGDETAFEKEHPGFNQAYYLDEVGFRGEVIFGGINDLDAAIELYNNEHEDKIVVDDSDETRLYNPGNKISDKDFDLLLDFGKSLVSKVNASFGMINPTRLDYTTPELSNKREIALTVPTVEPWNENDKIHFGDAGGGRAIAWIRFGDAMGYGKKEEAKAKMPTDEQRKELVRFNDRLHELSNKMDLVRNNDDWQALYEEYKKVSKEKHEFIEKNGFNEFVPAPRYVGSKRVLVIDEIQSKRHQDAREQGGYKNPELQAKAERRGELSRKFYSEEGLSLEEKKEYDALQQELYEIGSQEVVDNAGRPSAAPFEKNWHELAMKRMLRYAAENGYDSIAWTTGDQQAERYNIGTVLDYISRDEDYADGARRFELGVADGGTDITLKVDDEGNVIASKNADFRGRKLSEVVGKDLAVKMMALDVDDDIDVNRSLIGAEGMKGFYDQMLVSFMNKYGKKWGVSVHDITLNGVYDEVGHDLVMHGVDITPEMKESVMQGQLMFSKEGGEKRARTPLETAYDVDRGGIKSVVGEENVSDFYINIYRAMPVELRMGIVSRAEAAGWNFRSALKGRLAELALAGEDNTGVLGLATTILSDYAGRPLDEATARYILWRTAQPNDSLTDIQKVAIKRRFGVGDESSDIRFSKGDLSSSINDASRNVGIIAEGAKESLDQRKKALKGDLLTAARAMSAQKTYDKSTVDTITGLARMVLREQEIDSMNRREVARLLGLINSTVGKAPRTVKKNADILLDIIVENLLKKEEKALSDLVKVEATRTNASGVETQGALDLRGQNTLRAYKAGVDMTVGRPDDDETAGTVYGRLSVLQDRLDSPDDSVRAEAEAEYDGLTLALEYHENIKASRDEERGIRNEMADAANEARDGKMSRPAYHEFVEDAESALRENRIERIESYRELRIKMGDLLSGSRENTAAFREKERERIEQIRHLANSDMEGRSADPDKRPSRLGNFLNSSFVRFFTSPLATFDQMLRAFGSKSVNGQGYLWNKYMRQWIEAREKAITGTMDAKRILDEKVSEVFGEKMLWSDLYQKKFERPTLTVKWWGDGKMEDHELTQGQLLYIYMVNKMADGRMKLRRMGISEEDVQAIRRQMDERLITLADWLQDEYLVNLRNKYNAVHERLFGASMAAIEDYFPLIINKRSLNKSEDIAQEDNADVLPATTTGSIIKRRRNSRNLDLLNADAFDVVIRHIEQMEQWAAFAEYNRDLNTLLSYNRFRNQVKNMETVYGTGDVLWKNFRDVSRIAGGVYRPTVKRESLDNAAVNLAKGVTAAKINFRVYTAMKQFLSMPAFLADANVAKLAKGIASPKQSWEWAMENLPMFENRWKSRIAGDTRLMNTDSDWKLFRKTWYDKLSRAGMAPNAFVDALTVAIGAKAMYDTKYEKYINDGYTEEKAAKKAKQDATVLYNETQQSNEGAFVSTVQLDRTLLSTMISVFRNSSMGFQRQLHDALRNLSRRLQDGYKEQSVAFMTKQMVRDGLSEEQAAHAAERQYNRGLMHDAARVATFGLVVQFAWNLGGSIAYLLFGDDDDEKEQMVREAFIHALFGGIEGLAGGNIMSDALNMVAKGESLRNYDPSLLPLISDMKRIYSMMDYDKVAGMNEILNLAAQAFGGVNPATLTDAVVAVVDACGGQMDVASEAMLLIMRVLQVPQSQLDEIYIDELGISARKARRLSYSQMAKRYARYKVARGAGAMGWAYSDEKEEKREQAYLKRFKTLVNERKDNK